MRTPTPDLPSQVQDALVGCGVELRTLRLRRRLPMAYAAERAGISRSTLHKIERGDPGVALGSYARVLASYGMLDRIEHLADPRWDRTERELARSHLPVRVRRPDLGEP